MNRVVCFLDGPPTSQKKKTGYRLHICFRSVLDNIFFIFSTTTDNNTNSKTTIMILTRGWNTVLCWKNGVRVRATAYLKV